MEAFRGLSIAVSSFLEKWASMGLYAEEHQVSSVQRHLANPVIKISNTDVIDDNAARSHLPETLDSCLLLKLQARLP